MLAFLAAACSSGAASVDLATPTASPATTAPVASATSSTATTTPAANQVSERPLAELSQEAADYLDGREGQISVSVVDLDQGLIYTWNGHEKLHMASVAKVAIMLTVMQQALEQERDLTPEELSYLEPMITISDNTTASLLWEQAGGGQAVEAYLRSLDLQEIDPSEDSCWGASYASAHDVSLLLAKLADGDILNPQMRDTALDLLSQVDPSQQWGVLAAVPEEVPEGTLLGIKDGWYPAACGWWVNSAGVILPGNGAPGYTIAVLTNEQSTMEYGIETIETVATLIHEALH